MVENNELISDYSDEEILFAREKRKNDHEKNHLFGNMSFWEMILESSEEYNNLINQKKSKK